MRVLAVDFGEKRIGLATSDASGQIATPRATLKRTDDRRAAEEIAQFCREEEIERIVVGLPRSPAGVESPFAGRVRSFARRLERACEIPVSFHEETLTSLEAARDLPPGSPREEIDRRAAALLLEDFLRHGSMVS